MKHGSAVNGISEPILPKKIVLPRENNFGHPQKRIEYVGNFLINPLMPRFQNKKAFSIIEILFAVAILSGVFYTITSLFSGSSKQVDQMRKNEEISFIQQNAETCFRSLGYSGFADASGNLLMTGGSLSFGADNSKCLTGVLMAPEDIVIHTYF